MENQLPCPLSGTRAGRKGMTVWPKLSAMAQAVSEAPSMEEAGLPQATMTASDSYFQVSYRNRNLEIRIFPGFCFGKKRTAHFFNRSHSFSGFHLHLQAGSLHQKHLQDAGCLVAVRIDPAVPILCIDAQRGKECDRPVRRKTADNLPGELPLISVITGLLL